MYGDYARSALGFCPRHDRCLHLTARCQCLNCSYNNRCMAMNLLWRQNVLETNDIVEKWEQQEEQRKRRKSVPILSFKPNMELIKHEKMDDQDHMRKELKEIATILYKDDDVCFLDDEIFPPPMKKLCL